jgi:hypothetical protein
MVAELLVVQTLSTLKNYTNEKFRKFIYSHNAIGQYSIPGHHERDCII